MASTFHAVLPPVCCSASDSQADQSDLTETRYLQLNQRHDIPSSVIDRLSCGFTSHSTQNRPSFRRRFPEPISWLGLEKTKLSTTKACIHQSKEMYYNTNTHTHPFNGPFSGTTRVSLYQKDITNLDFTEARDSEWQWQWHQLGHMQVCISHQTDNHASTPPLKFFTGRMPFLPPNQQRQSTEGIYYNTK